ncbi:MAG: iron ABC transporter permease [Puniceicoccales bacterium]|jgi:iron complex transport system permease protein|nr:iron ABC transporter permease [Puniceicoccales bacterium]
MRLASPKIRFVVVALAFAVLIAISLAPGPTDERLSWTEFFHGLLRTGALDDGSFAQEIIWGIRLPRLAIAMLAGAALASSGVVMQAFFRNALASPGLLGVSAGATTGAVSVIGAGLAVQSLFFLPAAAIVGAFASTGLVIGLARSGASTERLLLSGVALNSILGAVTSYVLSNTTLTYERNAQIFFWLLGGLENRTWEHVCIASPILLILALLYPLGRPMDLISLGADEAHSLGVDVRTLQLRLIILSTALTALATAVVGTVGFVGLVVPHILRLLTGAEHRRLLPFSMFGGAAFMLVCDIIGRHAGGLRIGIVTSLIGGPFFLWLLRKK